MAYDPLNPYAGDEALSGIAESSARAAYQQAMASNLGEQIALEKAKQAWLQTYQTSQLTGMFNGQPTWAVDQAQGVTPGGAPLLSAAELYGGSGGADGGGTPTLGAISEQDRTMLGYLQLLGQERGVNNAFQYAKLLRGTPQGLTDIVNAAAGRLRIPQSGMSLNTDQGASSTGIQPGGGLNVTSNPVQQGGPVTMEAGGSGGSAPALDSLNAVNHPDQYQPPTTSPLPLPNQIDPLAWQRFDPSQRKLLLGDYEAQHFDPTDVEAERQAALPQYRGAQRAGISGLFA